MPASPDLTCSASAGCASIPAPLAGQVARRFRLHTLIPIALAYLVAHYFSLFVFQEQAQFAFLLSDPSADGTN